MKSGRATSHRCLQLTLIREISLNSFDIQLIDVPRIGAASNKGADLVARIEEGASDIRSNESGLTGKEYSHQPLNVPSGLTYRT